MSEEVRVARSAKPDRRAPGRLEDEILAALVAADGALTTSEVLGQLGDDLAYTTVMTTLTRMHAKGIVTRERAGRSYAYAVASPEERVARSMNAALDDSPERDLALARFVDTLNPDDLPVLRRLLGEQSAEQSDS